MDMLLLETTNQQFQKELKHSYCHRYGLGGLALVYCIHRNQELY